MEEAPDGADVMLPLAHVAFAYLWGLPLLRPRPTLLAAAFLAAGALFPTVAAEVQKELRLFDASHFWVHSPLILAVVGGVAVAAYAVRAPGRLYAGLFAVGLGSHLAGDFLTDFAILYLDRAVTDIGVPWVYPWTPFVLREPRMDPGFAIAGWRWAVEAAWVGASLWSWNRLRGHAGMRPVHRLLG